MRQPIGEQECRLLGEGAVIEDQKEFATADVAIEALDRVRDPGREIPEVALFDVLLEDASVLVDGREPRAAAQHVRPFGLFVPMELADGTGLQAHIASRRILTPAKSLAIGSSRMVASRAHPPFSIRTWLSANDHFIFGIEP